MGLSQMKDINHYRKLIKRYENDLKSLNWDDPYTFGYYLYIKWCIQYFESELYKLGVR